MAFTVEPNTSAARTAPIIIGGQTFTVMQAGACRFAIAPEAQTVPAAGAEVDVVVTAPAGCEWTAHRTNPGSP